MEVTVQLPDEIALELGNLATIPRQLLEALAVENYRSEKLTRHQVGQLLGLDYWQTEEFLAKHNAKRPCTLEDIEVDRNSLAGLPKK
jgi:hypothetical protein